MADSQSRKEIVNYTAVQAATGVMMGFRDTEIASQTATTHTSRETRGTEMET